MIFSQFFFCKAAAKKIIELLIMRTRKYIVFYAFKLLSFGYFRSNFGHEQGEMLHDKRKKEKKMELLSIVISNLSNS